MDATIATEAHRARAVAQEYRRKGHEVIEEPSPGQLPDFLSGFQPDLIILKGNETVVVEVKSRASLAKEPRIRDLAQLLESQPGWSFELVVVAEGDTFNPPEGTSPMEREDILHGIEEAERLSESEFSIAALLLAWSASEATVRLLTLEEGISIERLTPSFILNRAATNGVISREDYDFLTTAMQYRNALVHGFKIIDFDESVTRDLIATTKRLLQSTTT